MITETGGFKCECGLEHGLLPPEPPQSPPHGFHCAATDIPMTTGGCGRFSVVDPEQCAVFYRKQGKLLPSAVTLVLPDGTTETHDWVAYGRRFAEIAEATAARKPIPPAGA